jgi:hypothetical protein
MLRTQLHIELLNKLKKQIRYNTGPRQNRRGFLFVECFYNNHGRC